jgi:hypothetical protein
MRQTLPGCCARPTRGQPATPYLTHPAGVPVFAAIRAEELRGQLKRFYVKQVETGEAGEFDRMTNDELRAFIAEQEEILTALEGKPKTKH